MHRLHFSVMQIYDVSPLWKALKKDNDEGTDEDIGENLALRSQRVPRGLCNSLRPRGLRPRGLSLAACAIAPCALAA